MSDVDDDTVPANVSETSARARNKRPFSVSPTKRNENLCCLLGGCCLQCEEELGSDCKAVQCDLCAAWIHAECEGLLDEVYGNVMALGGLNNAMYYCDTNNCISRIKQLLFTRSYKPDHSHLIVQQEDLSKHLDDLSLKIAKQQTLQQSIHSISSITDSINQMDTNSHLPSTPSGSALDIVDEMADRDRRKHNIVVYNFTEGNDRKADIESFKTLS